MPRIVAVPGTHDLLPPRSDAWERLHRIHREVAVRHGYRLADTPIFEFTDLFERGVGTGTDVVEKEMYTFVDPGGRSLTLRPEGTAGMVRACLSAGLLQQWRPLRLHYAGPMFRRERPQRGRYRQFHQVGIECIGERSPQLDVEVVEVGWRFLQALGLDGVSVQLNSLGDVADRSRYRAALVAYYDPHRPQLCPDCRRRLEVNPLRLLDCKRDATLAEAAPVVHEVLSQESASYFDEVLRGLRAADVPVAVNPRLVRGLDYYAHTAFEFWHRSMQGAQNALGGGGRYDGLAELLGYPPTPGVGYAFGVERLLLVLEDTGVVLAEAGDPTVVVCSVSDSAEQAETAAAVARRLRRAGTTAVLDVSARRLARKLELADRLAARLCLIVGDDEVRTRTVQLKRPGEPSRRLQLDTVEDEVIRAIGTTSKNR